MGEKTEKLLSTLKLQPVVPVLIIEDAKTAVPLAKALVAGGLKAIEITLRTEAAMVCLERIRSEVPEMLVGVGTILTPKQVNAVKAAGVEKVGIETREVKN